MKNKSKKLRTTFGILFVFALLLNSKFQILNSVPSAHASVVAASLPVSLKTGLVGYWTFDGKNMVNNVADSSGSGNNGDMIGFTSTSSAQVAGKVGQALSFNGVNNSVNVSSLSLTNKTYTFSFWIKSTQKGEGNLNTGYLFDSQTGRLVIGFVDANLVANKIGYYDGSWHDLATTPSDGLWHNLIFVLNNSNSQGSYYKDGIFVNSAAYTGTNIAGSSALASRYDNTSSHYLGLLDDVRIYNYALSTTSIMQLYSMGSATHVATSPSSRGSSGQLASGLVGYWTFDGKNMVNNVADSSGSGNTGYLQFGTAGNISTSSMQVPGKVGQALNFDGVDDYVTASTGTVGNNFTYSFWIKPNNLSSAPVILAGTTAANASAIRFCRIGGNGAGKVNCSVDGTSGGSAVTTTVLKTGTFYHVAYVVTGNVQQIFLNGVNEGSATETLNTSGSFLCIGDGCNSGLYFSGVLDDVRIYNYALSTTSIQQLYSMGSATHVATSPSSRGSSGQLASGLVGYWTFDGKNMVSNVADVSGQGNHGYMFGFTSTSSAVVQGKVGQGLQFDGANDYVQTVSDPLPTTQVSNPNTECAWAMTSNRILTPGSISQNIVGFLNAASTYGLRLGNTGAGTNIPAGNLFAVIDINGVFSSASTTSSTVFVNNKWVHVCSVWNGSAFQFYVNGAATTTTATVIGGAVGGAANKAILGSRDAGLGGNWIGSLDDVRIYNYALSTTSIMQLYQVGR